MAKPAQELARAGWKVRKLAVTRDGAIDLEDVAAALKEPTGIVSVMLANNETGVIQDVAAIAERARAARAWMHTDAVQALGKIEVDFAALNVHAMTLSAHKIYGPKGRRRADRRQAHRAETDHRGRRPRAGHALGNRERAGDRRLRRGCRAGRRTPCGIGATHRGAS